MKKTILAVLLLLSAFAAFAQETEAAVTAEPITDETSIILDDGNGTEPQADAAGDGRFFTTWDFIKVILILVAVVLVIYAIFYGLKKAGGMKYQSDELIRLLGSQSLTQNGSVHLIEVGARYYLVGCGDGAVSHIADIDDKETIDEIILKAPKIPDGKKSFSDFFNFKIGGKSSPAENLKERIRNNNKFMHDQAERLKKM